MAHVVTRVRCNPHSGSILASGEGVSRVGFKSTASGILHSASQGIIRVTPRLRGVGTLASEEEPFVPDIWMSQGGNDSYDGSTEETPVKTATRAVALISSERRSIGLMGTVESPQTYSIANGTGCFSHSGTNCAQLPSGNSRGDPVILRAVNDGGAIIDGTGAYNSYGVFVGRNQVGGKISYVVLRGFKVSGTTAGIHLYNTSYAVVKEVACNGMLNIGTNEHNYGNTYDLVEDVWIWANGPRGLSANYRSDYNVWRRVVLRADDAVGDPCIGFTVYNSNHCSIQNYIIVDRLVTTGTRYGDFSTAQHSSYSGDQGLNKWLGPISFNSNDTPFHFEADAVGSGLNPVAYLENALAFKGYGGFNLDGEGYVEIQNFLSYMEDKGGLAAVYQGLRMAPDTDSGGFVRNGIIHGAGYYGCNSVYAPSYMDVHGTWSNGVYNQTTCSTGCHTSDPEADGSPASLLYPIRVEEGSALSGAGYGGADIGPNITKRYGADGAISGDSGFEDLSDDDIWPYPNEARIRTDMRADSDRGFCADDETLTHYICDGYGNGSPYS